MLVRRLPAFPTAVKEAAPGVIERHHFTLGPHLPAAVPWLHKVLTTTADRALGLPGLNAVYQAIPHGLDAQSFASRTLEGFGVDFRNSDGSLSHIPRRGACIVVANHPHGGLDGVGALALLMRLRPDVRIMANHLLERFQELREVFIGVDPFGGPAAARFNVNAVRHALRWLRGGGLLFMFPGGEVSSLNLKSRTITDPTWDGGVGWLVEKSQAPVVPMFIDGRNSIGFQCAGLVHERLRTALLVREMLNHRGTVVEVHCAPPIDRETLAALGSRQATAAFLQTATYLIKARSSYRKPMRLYRVAGTHGEQEPVAPPQPAQALADEIAELQAHQRLLGNDNLDVYYARADQIPHILQEIGRLRELSFRQVGEGTGKRVDIDLFDSYYIHLFIWDRAARQVIGGYRLGEADRIIERYGARGLYVRTLFRFDRALKKEMNAALEVGRSFVRPEHQRNYSSLMLLWKGIGAFVARHPRYRMLFGPVSISNDYHPVSQQIIVRFLLATSMEAERASQVRPRRPFRSSRGNHRLVDLNVSDLRIISTLLNIVEQDDVAIPVLLRQYLKLNGRILGFNVDADFSNSIDCLLWVDLTRTAEPLLRKYMGNEGCAHFLRYHRARDAEPVGDAEPQQKKGA